MAWRDAVQWQWDVVKLAMGSLNANKLRGGLTILGIVIGITSVVGMVTLIEGLNASMRGQLDQLGSDTIRVRRWDPGVFTGEIPDSLTRRPWFDEEDAEEILRDAPSVMAVTVSNRSQQRIRHGGNESRLTQVIGVDDAFLIVHARRVEDGRPFTGPEVRGGARLALIGAEIRKELFAGLDPVGAEVRLGSQRFEVVGVLEERGSFLGQSLDNEILIPRLAVNRYFGVDRDRNSLAIKPVSPERTLQAKDEVTEVLRRTRGLRPADPNNFALVTQGNLLSLYEQLTGAIFIVMVGIASVALLVGGIGVMNIMLVSVTERTREIGIRKALGATRRQILFQFLAEAMVLTGVGGVLGIGLGFGIGTLVGMLSPLPAAVPVWAYVAAFGTSVGVGLFFGMWPAVRASRLNPVDALRYE